MSNKRLPILRARATMKAAQNARVKEKAKADERLIQTAVRELAVAAGIHDPEDLELADLSAVAVTEAGGVTGAAEAVEGLRKAKPYLFSAASTSSSAPVPRPKPL